MKMSAEAGIGGVLLAKSGLLVGLVAALAAGLGIAIAWPKNAQEAFYRFTAAFAGSLVLGVPFAFAAWHQWPWLFTDMIALVQSLQPALAHNETVFLGVLLAAIPFLFAGALPFWWLSRAVVLWFDRRKGKDAGELLEEGVRTYKRLRP